MKEYLKKLPQEIQDLISLAGEVAGRHKMPAYLVGGFVRDLILGVQNLDLDIAVEGDGIKFAEDFGRILKAKITRHQHFGTATLVINPDLKIDIATARKEFYPEPAHLPVISASGLRDDHFRRDFTINAMAIAINGDNFGELVDFFGGRADLKKKSIRILHELSFIDDPTRILRAVRFEKRYNFKIEPKTLKFLKEAVKLKMLQKVQPQRVRDDLILILKEKDPVKVLKRLEQLAGFGFIEPKLKLAKNNYQLLTDIQKQINWFNKAYPHRRLLDAWLIYLMGLFDKLTMLEVRLVCRRFVFRTGEEIRLLNTKGISKKFIYSLSRKNLKPAQIFSLLEPLSYEVILFIKAKYRDPQLQKHIAEFFEIYNGMRILISGEDLHKMGMSPGPRYQKIFTKVLNAKLNGEVKTKDDELQLIKKLIRTEKV